jgi:hypothetical protein
LTTSDAEEEDAQAQQIKNDNQAGYNAFVGKMMNEDGSQKFDYSKVNAGDTADALN